MEVKTFVIGTNEGVVMCETETRPDAVDAVENHGGSNPTVETGTISTPKLPDEAL